jgi:methyl-accepting chemotaxis protein
MRTLSLRTLFSLQGGAIALLLTSVGVSFYQQEQISKAMTEAQRGRYASRLLATELRQSSGDLTRLARTYVVTGDEKEVRALVLARAGDPQWKGTTP